METKYLGDDDFSYALGAKGASSCSRWSMRVDQCRSSTPSSQSGQAWKFSPHETRVTTRPRAMTASVAAMVRQAPRAASWPPQPAASSSTWAAWRAWRATGEPSKSPCNATLQPRTQHWTAGQHRPVAQGTARRSQWLAPASLRAHRARARACRSERNRAHDYLKWLLEQRKGHVSVVHDGRDDVNVVDLPTESIGFITGHKGMGLREVESRTGTFIFTNGTGRGRGSGGTEELLVFGHDSYDRKKAAEMVEDRVDDHKRMGGRGGGGGGGGGGGYGGGGYGGGGGGGGGRGGYDDRRDDRGRGGDRRDDRRREDSRDRGRSRRDDSRDRDRRRSRSR